MGTKRTTTFSGETIQQQGKLLSLLALASGAVALPQTSEADIVYTDLTSSPVSVGYGGASQFMFNTLPGSAQMGFRVVSHTKYDYTFGTTRLFRTVLGPANGAGAGMQATASGFAVPLNAGVPFPATSMWASVAVGVATDFGHAPASGYTHKYFAWMFFDSTNGNARRYGWADVSLSISSISGFGGGPFLTIYGYAWDNTGAKPTMGATPPVPEPGSMGLLALGALAVGARGVRAWRKNRVSAPTA